MFCQQGLELLRGGLPRLRRLEMAGLDTARDQVLATLIGDGGGDGAGGAAASLQVRHVADDGRVAQEGRRGVAERQEGGGGVVGGVGLGGQ
jgi:hypothetical protein